MNDELSPLPIGNIGDRLTTTADLTGDFTPVAWRRRQAVLRILGRVAEDCGYTAIGTPVLCPQDAIIGHYGEHIDSRACALRDGHGNALALPYDLTVPLARYVAANQDNLPMPFKSYQVQRVWRSASEGVVEETQQCDLDILGAESLLCEAEVINIVHRVLAQLGLDDFQVRLGDRAMLRGLLEEYSDVAWQADTLMDILATLNAADEDTVAAALSSILNSARAQRLARLLRPEQDNAATLAKLPQEAAARLHQVLEYSAALGVPDSGILIDPALARRSHYYTGTVMSVSSPLGPMATGGRYDSLCERFSARPLSGCGASFVVGRLMRMLASRDLLPQDRSPSRVLISMADDSDAAREDALALYRQLMDAKIAAELYLELHSLDDQLAYAADKRIPFALLRSDTDRAEDSVNIVRITSGHGKKVPLAQLTAYLTGYYEAR